MSALAALGLGVEENIIDDVYLIDETYVHDIVSKAGNRQAMNYVSRRGGRLEGRTPGKMI